MFTERSTSDELPDELTRREGRLAAIRTAKAALEAEHAAAARTQAEQAAVQRGENEAQITEAGDATEAAAITPTELVVPN